MEKTGVVIGRESWLVLQDEPFYSARFIDRDGTEELALVVRVEELEWFIDSGLPLRLTLTMWRSSDGVWLAAIAYQLHPSFGDLKSGVFFLNPRQAADATILYKLPQQERLTVIFLTADCATHYTLGVPQDAEEREQWRQRIQQVGQTEAGEMLDGEMDPLFEAALDEFQSRYDVDDILFDNI